MIPGLHGKYMFNFIRYCQTVFQSDHTIFNSHDQCLTDIVVLYLYQHFTLLVYIFFYLSNSNWCKVVFHCGFKFPSLIGNDVGHLLLCLFATLCPLWWRVCSAWGDWHLSYVESSNPWTQYISSFIQIFWFSSYLFLYLVYRFYTCFC